MPESASCSAFAYAFWYADFTHGVQWVTRESAKHGFQVDLLAYAC